MVVSCQFGFSAKNLSVVSRQLLVKEGFCGGYSKRDCYMVSLN